MTQDQLIQYGTLLAAAVIGWLVRHFNLLAPAGVPASPSGHPVLDEIKVMLGLLLSKSGTPVAPTTPAAGAASGATHTIPVQISVGPAQPTGTPPAA